MARNVPLELRRALHRGRGKGRGLVFLTLRHSTFVAPIRVVGDQTKLGADRRFIPYRLDGQDYQCFPFSVRRLPERDQIVETRLVLGDVDRAITSQIDRIIDPVNVRLEIYSSLFFEENGAGTRMQAKVGETPVPHYVIPIASLREVETTISSMSGVLRPLDVAMEMWPRLRLSVDVAPGLHL